MEEDDLNELFGEEEEEVSAPGLTHDCVASQEERCNLTDPEVLNLRVCRHLSQPPSVLAWTLAPSKTMRTLQRTTCPQPTTTSS